MTKIYSSNQEALQALAKTGALPENGVSVRQGPTGTLSSTTLNVSVPALPNFVQAMLGEEGYRRWQEGKAHDLSLTAELQRRNLALNPVDPPKPQYKPSFFTKLKGFGKLLLMTAKELAVTFKELFWS